MRCYIPNIVSNPTKYGYPIRLPFSADEVNILRHLMVDGGYRGLGALIRDFTLREARRQMHSTKNKPPVRVAETNNTENTSE